MRTCVYTSLRFQYTAAPSLIFIDLIWMEQGLLAVELLGASEGGRGGQAGELYHGQRLDSVRTPCLQVADSDKPYLESRSSSAVPLSAALLVTQ